MLRRTACLGLCLLALPARADERPAAPPTPVDTASEDARFAAFVAEAERELAAGRKVAAAIAYIEAYRLRHDPVIGGRLGVLFAQLHQTGRAAERLADALRFAQTSTSERQRFFTAYETVRALGSWVLVKISHAGTTIVLDGEELRGKQASAFWMFLLPGEHQIRARLEGYEDVSATFTTVKGENKEVPLDFSEIPKAEPEEHDKREPCVARIFIGSPETPGYSKQEDPFAYEEPKPDAPQKKEGPSISITGGPVLVFGVASWQPALGGVAGVAWKPKEYFSLGLEGRAAWVTSGIEGRRINAMTAGALASACLHWRWLFGCGLGHLGVISIDSQPASYKPKTDTLVKPGVGGRVGASFGLTRGFVLGGTFDVLGLNSGVKVVAGQTVLVDHPPVMISGQILGGWEF